MMIMGVDYHPGFQQIAFLVEENGECGERRLSHSDGEAENFYRDLKARGISVRVGMETTGFSRWFERLRAELGFEVWIGDAAESKTRRAKKQKTDRLDAELLLKLLLEERFPRIWVPSPENRDLRQLLWHRHRLVQMPEIGIRMAIGAQRENVLWMVLRETLALALIGLAIGIPCAVAACRLIASMLFGLTSSDVPTIAAASILLLFVALLAGYLPARRVWQLWDRPNTANFALVEIAVSNVKFILDRIDKKWPGAAPAGRTV